MVCHQHMSTQKVVPHEPGSSPTCDVKSEKPDHSHHTTRYSQILDRANIDFYIYIYLKNKYTSSIITSYVYTHNQKSFFSHPSIHHQYPWLHVEKPMAPTPSPIPSWWSGDSWVSSAASPLRRRYPAAHRSHPARPWRNRSPWCCCAAPWNRKGYRKTICVD